MPTLEKIAEEEAGRVRSWKAYGNGLLLQIEDKLQAVTVDGRKKVLLTGLRDDAAKIGREWSYRPYAQGAILYEFSRKLGHEGMETDRREEITAYRDDGTKKKLYDSGEQWIYRCKEWQAYQKGIVLREEEVFQQARREREAEFLFIQYAGAKKVSRAARYKSKIGQWDWKVYGHGLLVKERIEGSENFFAFNEQGQRKKLTEFNEVKYWEGYGRGLLLGRWNELWAFRDEHHSQRIFQGEWKEAPKKPHPEGMLLQLGKELILFRDDGTKEVVYSGKNQEGELQWDSYDDTTIFQQTREIEEGKYNYWYVLRGKEQRESLDDSLAGLDRLLQGRKK